MNIVKHGSCAQWSRTKSIFNGNLTEHWHHCATLVFHHHWKAQFAKATIYMLYPWVTFNFSNLFILNEGDSYWHPVGPMKQQSKSYVNEEGSCHIIPRLKQTKQRKHLLSDFYQNVNSHCCIRLSLEYRYTKSNFIFITWECSKYYVQKKIATNHPKPNTQKNQNNHKNPNKWEKNPKQINKPSSSQQQTKQNKAKKAKQNPTKTRNTKNSKH